MSTRRRPDDSPTPEQIAAAAPALSPRARERLRQALLPTVPQPSRTGRADIHHTAVAAARDAVTHLIAADATR